MKERKCNSRGIRNGEEEMRGGGGCGQREKEGKRGAGWRRRKEKREGRHYAQACAPTHEHLPWLW